jgi:hypothetical protein
LLLFCCKEKRGTLTCRVHDYNSHFETDKYLEEGKMKKKELEENETERIQGLLEH